MAKPDKQPKFGANPPGKKKPVVREHCFEDGHPLAWRFGQVDKAGPFAWDIHPFDKFHEVVHKLIEFEDKNWNEITANGSHPIETSQLSTQARSRLIEIERDDLDYLLSLRLSGPNRVWCVKTGHIIRPLWWDENHQVYPVKKDPADRKKEKRRKK
ncbi:hypothetical protein ACQKOH_16175 [Sphingomonas sp. NPDC092331]|jgi:hypothetical protein|uniref:hypothetical protein n=1 Tax=unclassified Sphingomonas TaxID=196159 RepID=UPI0031F4C35B